MAMTEILEYWQVDEGQVFYTNRGITIPSELTPELVEVGVKLKEFKIAQKDNDEVFVEVQDTETHYRYFDGTTMCSESDKFEQIYKSKDKEFCSNCHVEVKEFEE